MISKGKNVPITLNQCLRGAIEAFVGILVLDELFYRLLLARVKDATGRNPLEVLRTDLPGAIAAHGDAIDTALRKLMALPHVHLISVETADFHGMLNPSFRDALCNNIAKKVTEVRVAYGDSISIRFADGSTIKISLEDEDYLGGEAVNFDVGGNVLWSL